MSQQQSIDGANAPAIAYNVMDWEPTRATITPKIGSSGKSWPENGTILSSSSKPYAQSCRCCCGSATFGLQCLFVALGLLCLFPALGLTQLAVDGTAEASATSPGPDFDDASSNAGATLTIETFAGINSVGGSQLTKTFATKNMPGAAVAPLGTFGTGVFDVGSRFGPAVWKGSVAKAGLTAYAGLATEYNTAAGILARGSGKLSFLKVVDGNRIEPRCVAEAFLATGPPKGVRGGAYAKDPVPLLAKSYPYAATIGGTDTYIVDTNGNLESRPTRLRVDPGERAWIELFADDSNDGTFLTTRSNPIWDFAIRMDGTGNSPTLSAFFTYDPSRMSIPGAPTNPSLYQSYADSLLNALMADTTDVSLVNAGSFGETLDINNPVTLFNGTYTAAVSSPGAADPNHPGSIDFEYGVGAGVAVVPEPSALLLFGAGTIGLLFCVRRKRKEAA